VPLALLVLLMAANAAWNAVFFRRKALGASAATWVPYSLLAFVLLALLARIDTVAATAFLLYVVYLPYAAWWLFALRRANAAHGRG
jgi:tryptophan-rich sensory protein